MKKLCKLPYLLWEGSDGIDNIRLVVTEISPISVVIERAEKDAMGNNAWVYDLQATSVITEAETFVPCLVGGLVDLLMR